MQSRSNTSTTMATASTTFEGDIVQSVCLPTFPVPPIDSIFHRTRDFQNLPFRADHVNRPLWVCTNHHIFLETYSPMYKQAYDFLIAISEPVSRPKFIHEYVITRYSLNTAASLGLTTEDIIRGLRKMSKTDISRSLVDFIRLYTANCGKVKILLRNRRYYIESLDVTILSKLVQDPTIRKARRDAGPFMIPIIIKEDSIYTGPQIGSIASASGLIVNTSGIAHTHATKEAIVHNSAAILASDKAALRSREERDPSTGFMISEISEETVLLQGTGVVEETKMEDDTASGATNASTSTGTSTNNNNSNTTNRDENTVEERDESGKVIRRRRLNKIDQRKAMGLVDSDEEDEDEDIEMITMDTNDEARNKPKIKTKRREKKPRFVYSIEVASDLVEQVRRRADELGYPMLEEYDFRKDAATPEQILPAALKPSAQIREYQEKALSKMFGNGRARSGIIVLPCGAGKTLVGITAMSTIGRSTLIVCSTAVAVQQWKNQIRLWTHLPVEHITMLAQGSKEMPTKDAKVIITTYSMLAHSQKRSVAAEELMKFITTQEWGLVLLDEVHMAPADKFKICIEQTHSRCKLGLTATLVREDEKINDLFFLLGPKLYEANWMDLSAQGFIATVRCIEVWCPMPPLFYETYLHEPDHKKRLSLCVANPEKINTLEALIRMHELRGDKIMVFSEQKFILELLARSFNTYFIHGDVPHVERMSILKKFGSTGVDRVNVIFISKIGDNSIDLPDTNVIIQLSAHYSSRRQEAQRLGRILRPKSHKSGSIDAFFYTLITQDTDELKYATKRQRFLVDQGYAYEVKRSSTIHFTARNFYQENSKDMVYPPYIYSDMSLQDDLLRNIRKSSNCDDETGYYDSVQDEDIFNATNAADSSSYDENISTGNSRSRRNTNMSSLSGVTKRGYKEM